MTTRTAPQKITVNIPSPLLHAAMQLTRQGITATIIEGLKELERRGKRTALRELRGKVRIDLDLDATRR